MRRTITLLATTLVVAAAITGSASAAALYTNSSHTTLVPVGPTSIGASSGSTQMFLRGGSPVVICGGVNVVLQVTQNSGGVVKFTIPNRAYAGCTAGGWNATPGGTLQISGSAITVGSTKAWLSTTLTGTLAGLTENLVSATGNPPVNGIFAQQPTSGASPVSIVTNNAGTLTGSGAPFTETGSFTLSGSYSLG